MSVFNTERIVSILRSANARRLVQARRGEVKPPASAIQLESARRLLGPHRFSELNSLLAVTTGLMLFPNELNKDEYIEFSFIPSEEVVTWANAYPEGMDIATGSLIDLLVLDFGGAPAGLIYYISHDPPSHCACFDSLESCIEQFISTGAPEKAVHGCTSEATPWPRVREFVADTQSVADFLTHFPGHYLVHDLRNSAGRAGFPYFVTDPSDLWRCGEERLWVQRMPKGIIDRLRWFWRTGSL
jgi:hypothetical protein